MTHTLRTRAPWPPNHIMHKFLRSQQPVSPVYWFATWSSLNLHFVHEVQWWEWRWVLWNTALIDLQSIGSTLQIFHAQNMQSMYSPSPSFISLSLFSGTKNKRQSCWPVGLQVFSKLCQYCDVNCPADHHVSPVGIKWKTYLKFYFHSSCI